MNAYLLTVRRPGKTRWSFVACEWDRGRVEDVYRISARDDDRAVSIVDVASIDARALYAIGFDDDMTIAEPPGEVLMRTDRNPA